MNGMKKKKCGGKMITYEIFNPHTSWRREREGEGGGIL